MTEPANHFSHGAETADFAALADPTAWSSAAARLLVDLGFSLINSDHPTAPGGSNLLVALRSSPTLNHFDPERISFWQTVAGRGRIADLDRSKAVPLETRVSWGSVRVVDRLDVDNRFLTFGGTLRATAVSDTETVVALRSPGPLARWSGHSQGSDPLAAEIGAFFGRLMVPIDFVPGVEQRLGESEAITLYAAFVRDGHDRTAAAARLRTAEDVFSRWVAAEKHRLESTEPAAWAAAAGLLADLALGHAG